MPERMTCQEHPTLVWQTPRNEEIGLNLTVRRAEEVTKDDCVATGGAQKIEHRLLVLMQVNCRSLIDTHNPDVVIGTESLLREKISNAKVFRDDYTALRQDGNT
jgi:hypothetical protein